jgi:hypothetical protein
MIKLRQLAARLRNDVLAQAILVTALSFSHLHDVAVLANQLGWKAWAYPPSVDLLMIASYRRIEHARNTPGASKKMAVGAFILSSTASLAANVIDALPAVEVAALANNLVLHMIVGAWPPVALVVSTLLGHTDARDRVSGGVTAEANEEHDGEKPALHLVPDDTPKPPSDTPGPDFPKQGTPGFNTAVVTLVSAAQPVHTFPSVEAFARAVNAWLVSHRYNSVSPMTVRRALVELGIKAA